MSNNLRRREPICRGRSLKPKRYGKSTVRTSGGTAYWLKHQHRHRFKTLLLSLLWCRNISDHWCDGVKKEEKEKAIGCIVSFPRCQNRNSD